MNVGVNGELCIIWAIEGSRQFAERHAGVAMGLQYLAMEAGSLPMETKDLDAPVDAFGHSEDGLLKAGHRDPGFSGQAVKNGRVHNVG